MRLLVRTGVVLAAMAVAALAATSGALAATGALGYQDCISGDTALGPSGSNACAEIPSATPAGENSGLFGHVSVAVSTDGNSLYSASMLDAAVAHFDRDPATGALSYQGCITGSTTNGPSGIDACAEIPSATSFGASSGLFGHVSMALSADGNSLYLTSLLDDAVARFDREPQTTITSAPARSVQRQRATFRFRSSEPRSTFECKLKRRHFRPCASPKTYRHLKLGRQVFRVRATDRSKNTDSTPAKRRWRIRLGGRPSPASPTAPPWSR